MSDYGYHSSMPIKGSYLYNQGNFKRNSKSTTKSGTRLARFGESSSTVDTLMQVDWPKQTVAWLNVLNQHFPELRINIEFSLQPKTPLCPSGRHVCALSCYDIIENEIIEVYTRNERGSKKDAQLEASIELVEILSERNLFDKTYVKFPYVEEDRRKLERNTLTIDSSIEFNAKEAKRNLQDLCKFLAIPLMFEYEMLGSSTVDDKSAHCKLTLTMPPMHPHPFPVTYFAEASEKGEQESIQQVSKKIVKKLIHAGWMEPKESHTDLNKGLMIHRFRNIAFYPGATIDTYNSYGGHTDNSAPGRLSTFCNAMQIPDPELIEFKTPDANETWFYTCHINLRFMNNPKIETSRDSSTHK